MLAISSGLVSSPSSQPFALAAHGWQIDLLPAIGGGISRCRFEGLDVLRPARPDADDALELACFALVPFSNRIAEGRFEFAGVQVALAPNMPGERHCLHGQGWRRPWHVERVEDHRCALIYRHEADEWCWDYLARQVVVCEKQAMSIEIELTNTSPRPMPAGLGMHPYFPLTPDCIVQTDPQYVWLPQGQRPRGERVPVPSSIPLRTGARAATLDLDHCFAGWSRTARITWPARGFAVHMEAGPLLRFLVIYAPPQRGFFCLEPVSHVIDAFNAPRCMDSGMCVLEPGATLRTQMRIRIERVRGSEQLM